MGMVGSLKTTAAGSTSPAAATQVRRELVSLLEYMKPYAIALTRNAITADDLLQATAVRALRFEDQFQPGTNLKAWMFTILRNEWLDGIRRTKRQATVSLDDFPPECFAVGPPQDMAVHIHEVGKAIDSLKVEQRETIMLISAGYGYEEAAAALGTNVGTIKSRLWRARTRLAGAVA